jgi:ornithine decarboxylase
MNLFDASLLPLNNFKDQLWSSAPRRRQIEVQRMLPLSHKFGCEPEMALDLLRHAAGLGLQPYGVSFHVGSQQTDPKQWDAPIARAASIFSALGKERVELRMVNLGGGFPAHYRDQVPPVEAYAEEIRASLNRHFGYSQPETILESGRSLVADAGVVQSEVILISRKSYSDDRRWVYLDWRVGGDDGRAHQISSLRAWRWGAPRASRTGRTDLRQHRHPIRKSELRIAA